MKTLVMVCDWVDGLPDAVFMAVVVAGMLLWLIVEVAKRHPWR